MTQTKPPPPPPQFSGGLKIPPPTVAPSQPAKQLEHYKLPMRDTYKPSWLAVLRECHYPTDVLVLDFETFFDGEYKLAGRGDGLSTVEYVTSPEFEVLGMGTLWMDGGKAPFGEYQNQTRFYLREDRVAKHLKYLQDRFGQNLEKLTVVAHNAAFDLLILKEKYGISPPHVIDTLGLARHWNARTSNSLDALTKRFALPQKGDTSQFKGVTYRKRYTRPGGKKKGPKPPIPTPRITPEQEKALIAYGLNDVMREWELFTILLPKLSRPDVELPLMKHTLGLFLQPTLCVDNEKGVNLIQRMEAEIDAVLQPTGLTRVEVNGDLRFEQELTDALRAFGDNPQGYYKLMKSGWILAIAKDDPQRAKLEKHPSEKVRQLMAARAATSSWPLHIKRVQRIMAQATAMGGKLAVPLKYYGAHTGRWSGGERINLQNLGSRGHALVNEVREMLVAPPGHMLVIADAAQIEARVLAWIAGQEDLVAKFARDEEVYCGFASKVLGWTVRKPRKDGDGIPAIEARMRWARNSIGKIGILGCGYGMGQDRIHEMGEGEFDLDTALKIRDTYRAEHPKITQFWKDIERAFSYTARYHKSCEMPRGLRFTSRPDCDVAIVLPCGRELYYHKVRLKEGGNFGPTIEVWNEMTKSWGHVWGGLLTENVVQAISRDILAEAILWLESVGIHTALHVHDEIVAVVPEHQPEQALLIAIQEMSKRLAWAPDCPLGAEGKVSKFYCAH